jgi:16S rRNA (guanine527-N7)-methyltransferase
MNTSLFTSHGFELSDSELVQFEKFLELFMTYNSHTNLSAIRDADGIVEKHFVDSLYGVSILSENIASHQPNNIRLLDIWSGWGFPGIPLKLVMPELQVTLLDSVGKKVKAMNHFVTELGLADITAIQERAEVLAKNPDHAWQYDFVVSRATAYMTEILTWAEPFLSQAGHLILYKMPSEDEQKEIRKVSKKLWLILEWELTYELGGKERILYTFVRR